MRFFSILAILLTAAGAQAAMRSGAKVVSGGVGYFASGLGTVVEGTRSANSTLSGFYGLGGDFEYYFNPETSFGGIVRYYSTTDSVGGVDYTNSLTSFGGIIRASLIDNTHWQFLGTTGVGMVGSVVKAGATTTDSGMGFGLYLGMTLLYRISNTMQIGVENLRMLGLGERLNGWVLSDYMFKIAIAI